MHKKLIKEGLERIYSRIGYVLLSVEFITDKMIRLNVLTPRWTVKEMIGLVDFDIEGNLKVRILRG